MRRLFTSLGCLVLAFAVVGVGAAPRSSLRVQRNVAYGTEPAQRLDLTTPEASSFPTVIFVHGGGLSGGDKADSDYGHVCDAFPARNIGCANINYRLMPSSAWPAQPEDVASAVAWIHDHIGASGGDPNRLFLLGHSSGAMLVALVAADPVFLSPYHLTSSVIRGVMPMGSIMWDDDLRQSIAKNGRDQVEAAFARDPRGRTFGSLDRYESQWPIKHVRDGLPPYLFLIAENEQINPPVLKTNQQFVDDAKARGNEAALRVFPGRTHYSMIRRLHENGDDVFAAVLDFIARHSSKR